MRRFAFNFLFFWIVSLSFGYAQNAPMLRFGLMADIQYCDCDTKGSRYYRNSLAKLEAAVDDFNAHQVEFVLNLGDLVDRNHEDLDAVTDRQRMLKARIYNVLGNHDYEGVDSNKKLYKKLGLPSDYFSFEEKGWRFIILNTNDVASYANINGRKRKELAAIRLNIKERNRDNGQEWNGGIGKRQMKWLEKQLQRSVKAGEKVLIFSHHPLYPAEIHAALNDQEVLDTVSPYAGIVKALISGHNHAGAYAKYKGIPCITLEGMVETAAENAYVIAEILPGKIVLTGKGRASSHEIEF
jgi:manganese-dependent ADP-ribose/CDP-alcohol diphosphatase